MNWIILGSLTDFLQNPANDWSRFVGYIPRTRKIYFELVKNNLKGYLHTYKGQKEMIKLLSTRDCVVGISKKNNAYMIPTNDRLHLHFSYFAKSPCQYVGV